MRVISKKKLRDFWEQPGCGDAKAALEAWHTVVSAKETDWGCFADIRRTYARADLVGSCVVFDIGGNKYRLVCLVLYPSQKVLIRAILPHAEYDKGHWKKSCGCLQSSAGSGSQDEKKKKKFKSKAEKRRRLRRTI